MLDRRTFVSGCSAGALAASLVWPQSRAVGADRMAEIDSLPSRHVTIEGLEEEVEILIDRWGVPHIYAKSDHDAFLAQGWNAARDRLWQMDLWRRRGLGEMAAAFGPAYVEQDKAARHFVYRGDIESEWAFYGAETRRRTESFVRGINAFVDAARSDPKLMPMEFGLGEYEPAFWTADDIVRVRLHGVVYGGALHQFTHAQVACAAGGLNAEILPGAISPPWNATIPEGIDLCAIPHNVLDRYHLARKSFALEPTSPHADPVDMPQGSNNWVLGASRTTTGRPILANDPHRALEVPALRYLVHLEAPGLSIIGAGQPPLPGIEIGHNGNVAFGFTIFPIAQEDLCVYEASSDEPNAYMFGGASEPMRRIVETIAVKGGPDVDVELEFTRHGPVLLRDRDGRRAYALRAAWLDTGGAPYLGSLNYLGARDRDQFGAALESWGGPGENLVCADREGRIGWFPAGLVPIWSGRGDGLLPIAGGGGSEWQGYLDRAMLPSERSPARDFIVTANQMNLPPDYPYAERPVGFCWHDPARFRRITDVIETKRALSLDDCRQLQTDCFSGPAKQLIDVAAGISIVDRDLAGLARWITGWDAVIDAASGEAAFFEIWLTRHLIPAVFRQLNPRAPIEANWLIGATAVAELMRSPDRRLGDDPFAARDRLIRETLAAAYDEARRLLGPDRASWSWGSLATVYLEHPFAKLEDSLAKRLNVGPIPYSGDPSCVSLAMHWPHDFRVHSGASVRLIMDVGNWDACLAINSPGQSGDPNSPHYRDLFDMWRTGEYFPLSYGRAAVEAVAEERIVLKPLPATSFDQG